MTIKPDMQILYVEDIQRSTDFYARLYGKPPVEASAGFVMFVVDGARLGLWLRPNVEPAAQLTGGGGEVCVTVSDKAEVDQLAAEWRRLGISLAQEPVTMDFGYTFVALDPDQHRVRVFNPSRR